MFRDLVFLIGSITRRFCAWCFVANSCRCVANVDYESASPCPQFTLTRESNEGSSWRGSLCRKKKVNGVPRRKLLSTIEFINVPLGIAVCVCVCVSITAFQRKVASLTLNTTQAAVVLSMAREHHSQVHVHSLTVACKQKINNTTSLCVCPLHIFCTKCFFGLWNEEKKLTV